MRLLIPALCFGFALQATGAAGQTLAGNEFNLQYSSSGLTSIKRVHDTYDTDYIAAGKALGDVLVRYRPLGKTAWQQAQSARSPQVAGSKISFTVGRAIPTLATTSRVSSSTGVRGLAALNDQIEPKNSADVGVPFFTWTN